MKFLVSLAALSCLLTCPSRAGEIEPFVTGGRIGARIRDLSYPATLARDLKSGLTSRLLARVELRSGAKVTAQSAVEVTVKYDLWDENFRVTGTVDHHVVFSSVLANIAEVRIALQDLRLPGLFAANGVPAGEPFALQANVLLNPVDRERMNRIREWVKENSTPAPTDPTSPDAAAPVGAATSNALFNRIFEQYASGKDLAAAWHEVVISRPFKVEGLANEGQ